MVFQSSFIGHLEEQRRRSSGYLRQTDLFVRQKKYESALEAILNAKRVDPENPYVDAYEERVRVLLESITTMANANKATDVVIQKFLKKADFYLSEGRFEKALEEAANAFTLKPNDPTVEAMKNAIIDAIRREHENNLLFNAPMSRKIVQLGGR